MPRVRRAPTKPRLPRARLGSRILRPVRIDPPPCFTRNFDGVDDRVRTATGGITDSTQYPRTFLAICKRESSGLADQEPLVALNATSDVGAGMHFRATTNTLALMVDGISTSVSTFTVVPADGWVLVAVTKATGSVAARFHKYVYSTATWTHQDGGAVGDGTLGATQTCELGSWFDGFETFDGNIAVAAVYDSILSDANLEASELALQALLDLSPVALWRLDQDTVTAVPDIVGGADETGHTGTTVVQDCPAGFDWTLGAGTNAPAEAAVGTGAADNASIAITANAEAAIGSGSAPDPTAAVAANAEAASGTGTAPDAQGGIGAQPAAATGVGAAQDPLAAIAVNADQATGTGAAFDATVSTANATNAPAEAATGNGQALDPTAAVGVNAGLASGTGVATDAQISITTNAGAATGIGAAEFSPVPPDIPPTFEAFGAYAAITINVGVASGTGQALDATVSTVAMTNAPADVATGNGQALDPAIAITVLAGVATGTGTANNPTVQVGREAAAEVAIGTGSALDATAAIGVPAGLATGTGSALDATVAFTIFPSLPPGFVVLAAPAGRAVAGDTAGTVKILETAGKVTVG